MYGIYLFGTNEISTSVQCVATIYTVKMGFRAYIVANSDTFHVPEFGLQARASA